MAEAFGVFFLCLALRLNQDIIVLVSSMAAGCMTPVLCLWQVTRRGFLMAGESGIFTPEHVAFVAQTGCGAILVGESLVKEGDPELAVKRLLSLA